MKISTRLAALALTVAAPLALAGTAQAAPTGSISGVAWLDENGNGVREANEAPIAGHYMVIQGTDNVVQTDAHGRYTFKNLSAGTYRVKSTDRYGWGQGWIGGASPFRGANGELWWPVELKAGRHVKDLDTGFVTGKVDYDAFGISISNPNPAVGDVIDIVGAATIHGNVYDQFGAQLTLPDGLRVVERLGGMPKYYETEPAGKVTGFFYDRRSPGLTEFVGARVVVEKPLNGAEIKLDAWKALYRSTDTNAANDVFTKSLTTTS
ncbi:MAG: hypothetical protein QOF58_4122 [Pseudonocardiales bacterium]|jgi:hypothetical protein|nr:hypothetical protein [Pseudonocardiales bacterium]